MLTLTQPEADKLIAMPKKKADEEKYEFPLAGKGLVIPIISTDGSESFLIDINRGRIRLTKCAYQNRYQKVTILVRLDIDGAPHLNPEVENVPLLYLKAYNGQTILCPHLHLYVEGFDDKWAIPAPLDKFSKTKNAKKTLGDFLTYCNIIELPLIEGGLF
jgi:hypothetical protein